MFDFFPKQPPRFDVALRDAGSKNAKTRALAAQSLANPPDGMRDQAIKALRPLLDDEDITVRYTALASLGEFDDLESLPKILSFMNDKAQPMRELSVVVASHFDDDRARDAILKALDSEHPEMRFQAIVTLAEASNREAIPRLIPKLRDDDQHVRAQAAMALAQFGDASGTKELLALLENKEHGPDAACALGDLRVEEAREKLGAIAERTLAAPELRAAAAAALVQLGDARGTPVLRSILSGWRASARSYAAQLAGHVGAAELVPDLAELVDKPRGADPLVVVHALVQLARDDEAAQNLITKLGRRTDEIGLVARTTHADDK